MRIETYNDAEMQQRAVVKVSQLERDQLCRLKGYLEGVVAPKEMRTAFSDLLDLVVGDGNSIGSAMIRK
jgi:hypothetical protein